jgi:hypothetical protein
MVYGSSAITYLPSANYASGGYASGRISLPVPPAQYIYSHFEHVSGVPAPEGTRGVAVSKLKILDVLIEQLAQMKKRPDPSFGATGPITDDRIDALIEQYETQIRSARAVGAQMPYAPKPAAPSGAVFNLVA